MARNFDRIGIAMIVPVIALLAATALVGTAHADPGNAQGRGHDKHDRDRHVVAVDGPDRDRKPDRIYVDGKDRDRKPDRVYIDRGHRDRIARYAHDHHWRCPPGLMQTRHGCLPKGHTKKRYVIGRPLPSYVVIEPMPRDLVVMLPPPPRGYIYRRVDGDVLLIAEATRHVLDAVVLFSAVR
ncbi:RcnB family protein [Parapedomonas caeni]